VDLVDLCVECLTDRRDRLAALIVGDLEHRPFGALPELAHRRHPTMDTGEDVVCATDLVAQLGVLANDPSVLAGVTRSWHPTGQLVDRRRPADRLELSRLAHLLGYGEMVDLAAARVQSEHRREHLAVRSR
jgi:hypothetical protein